MPREFQFKKKLQKLSDEARESKWKKEQKEEIKEEESRKIRADRKIKEIKAKMPVEARKGEKYVEVPITRDIFGIVSNYFRKIDFEISEYGDGMGNYAIGISWE
jgi:hypothetical protein